VSSTFLENLWTYVFKSIQISAPPFSYQAQKRDNNDYWI